MRARKDSAVSAAGWTSLVRYAGNLTTRDIYSTNIAV